MNRVEAEEKYKKLGLKVVHVEDAPGLIYEAHRHQKVYLYSLSGSAKIRLDNTQWQEVEPGQEVVINDGQFHEAVIGPEGWKYLFASKP